MNFKYYLTSYKKQNGTQSIRLKIDTNKSDVQYIDSTISILSNQWDSNRQFIKKHPLEENLNATLNSLTREVQNIYYRNTGISAKRLKFLYSNQSKKHSSSFIEFYQSIIDGMILRDKIRTARTNQHYVNKLKKYSSVIQFNELSVQWALEYETWLFKRGNKVNTVASNFKGIYAALNKAVKIGLIDKNPFKGYTIKTENVEKESLTLDEIQRIINFDIPKRFKGMIVARDLFLFSFYGGGMRFTDVCKLKWDNIIGNDIVYTMNKAKGRSGARRTIPLSPMSIDIIEKYKGLDDVHIFPSLYGYYGKTTQEIEQRIYIQNNAVNRSLKSLASNLGFKKRLSMHMSKHSFADYLVKEQVEVLMISKLLGHTKLATTEHYLKDFYHKEETDIIKNLMKPSLFRKKD